MSIRENMTTLKKWKRVNHGSFINFLEQTVHYDYKRCITNNEKCALCRMVSRLNIVAFKYYVSPKKCPQK